MIKVLLNGCNGKMGQVINNLIEQNSNFELVCGVDLKQEVSCSFPVYSNINDVTEKVDVIIDFSIPEASLKLLDFACKKQVPVVIATTGFSEDQMNEIKKTSQKIPIFQSANMSFDIMIMKKLVSWLAPYLKDTDIEIIESHHNRKIDSPSGTAQMLADSINQSLGNMYYCEYNRHNKHEKRNKNEIGISSIRGGNIVGEHTVQFIGNFETFEIKHTSYSRNVFAQGALKAADFIVSQPCGFYHMEDMCQI